VKRGDQTGNRRKGRIGGGWENSPSGGSRHLDAKTRKKVVLSGLRGLEKRVCKEGVNSVTLVGERRAEGRLEDPLREGLE